MFSLDKDIIKKLLDETLPSYQATCKDTYNLGFGFMFYSIARTMRPQKTIVIGSKAGFSVLCFALALKDNEGHTIRIVNCYDTELQSPNEKSTLHFIDPSYSSDKGDKSHWYGIGFWDDAEKVKSHWKKFGVADFIEHYKLTSQEYLKDKNCLSEVDLLYIDGDHSYEGILHDFNEYHKILKKDAIIIAHDVDPALKDFDSETGGYQALCDLDRSKFEVFRLPIYPGLAIVKKL